MRGRGRHLNAAPHLIVTLHFLVPLRPPASALRSPPDVGPARHQQSCSRSVAVSRGRRLSVFLLSVLSITVRHVFLRLIFTGAPDPPGVACQQSRDHPPRPEHALPQYPGSKSVHTGHTQSPPRSPPRSPPSATSGWDRMNTFSRGFVTSYCFSRNASIRAAYDCHRTVI